MHLKRHQLKKTIIILEQLLGDSLFDISELTV